MDKKVKIADSAFIAKGAFINGNVTIGEDCSIWYNAVIRGDNSYITIGDRSNVQDNCTVHCDPNAPVTIGNEVIIGHNAIVHGCTIEDNCMIGMGAIVMNDVHIGKNSIVAAGALITQRKEFPPNSMIMGSPAKRVGEVSEEQAAWISRVAKHYVKTSKNEMAAQAKEE